MFNYLVVSHKNWEAQWCFGFEDLADAEAILWQEEGDFRERILYDCTAGLNADFVKTWCFNDDKEIADDAAEREGYYWDESIDQYTSCGEIVDWEAEQERRQWDMLRATYSHDDRNYDYACKIYKSKQNYRDFDEHIIGSNFVTLKVGDGESPLSFSESGEYSAYIVPEYCIIWDHYRLDIEAKAQGSAALCDDAGYELTINGAFGGVEIYRAGSKGCIIRLLNDSENLENIIIQ